MAITFKETLEQLKQLENLYRKKGCSVAKKLLDGLLEAYQSDQKAQACLHKLIQKMGMEEMLSEQKYPLITAYNLPANSVKYGQYFNLNCYQALMPYCELAYLSEKEGVAAEHALKLSILFDTPKQALDYIQNNTKQNKNTLTMHDACLFILPDVTRIDFKPWKKVIKTNLNNAMFCKLMHKIPAIDELLRTNSVKKGKKMERDKIKNKKIEIEKLNVEFKKLKKHHGHLTAEESDKHDQLIDQLSILRQALFDLSAGITVQEIDLLTLEACNEHLLLKEPAYQMMVRNGLNRKSYEKFLALDRQDAGQAIPDITVDGKEINYPGYYLMKVRVQDDQQAARAAYLGKLTHCCQSLSGEAGESCVIHGLTNPQGGFYVLCKGDVNNPQIEDPLLAQCWVWRSKSGALVFDSVERVSNNQEKLVTALYERLAKQLVQKGHTDKVAIGTGSGIRFNSSYRGLFTEKESFQNYSGYHDSAIQVVLRDKNKPFYSYQKDSESYRELRQRVIDIMRNNTPLIQSPFLASLFNNLLLDREAHENLLLEISDIATENKRFDELDGVLYVNEQYVIGNLASQPEIFLAVLESNQLFLSIETEDGMTPLHYAAESGNESMVRLLLEKAASATINRADTDGRTPLHYAAESGNKLIVQRLLDKVASATMNIADDYGMTPLHFAVKGGNESVVQLLLENGASEIINKAQNNGMTPLFCAVLHGNESIVQLLLDEGASTTMSMKYDCTTLLHCVVQSNNESMMRLLLENGVSEIICAADRNGMTALHRAVLRGNESMVRLLLENGASASINKADNYGETPLDCAVLYVGESMVRLLSEYDISKAIVADKKGLQSLSLSRFWTAAPALQIAENLVVRRIANN